MRKHHSSAPRNRTGLYLHNLYASRVQSRHGLLTADQSYYNDRSKVIRVEFYLETVTSFTDVLIEDALNRKEIPLQPFSPFTRFGVFIKRHVCARTLPPFLSSCTVRTSLFCYS